MPDEPYDGYGMTRAEKSRLNRIAYWRRIKAHAEEKLRKLGDTPEVSRAEPRGDGTSPQN